MATVRIYKVAELLNTTSQEVMALLKRDHGIDVKSASSTIEEVVGRQFVERLARQRGVTLPGGDLFAEGAAARAPARKPVLAKKAGTEPAKPAAPALGPPRLNKAAKAIHVAERAAAAIHDAPEELEPVEAEGSVEFAHVEHVEPAAPDVAAVAHTPVEMEPAEPGEPQATPDAEIAASEAAASGAPAALADPGRVIGTKLRLRVEEAGAEGVTFPRRSRRCRAPPGRRPR